jgi:hypothetical protein
MHVSLLLQVWPRMKLSSSKSHICVLGETLGSQYAIRVCKIFNISTLVKNM